jgi:hypothetical protein
MEENMVVVPGWRTKLRERINDDELATRIDEEIDVQ